MPKKKLTVTETLRLERKELAEASLEEFIKLIHPRRMLGDIHRRIIGWWTRQDAKSHQLLLLPRDHMKSTLVAYRIVWELTKDPTLRILLISSTSNLATKQLKFIKDILVSDNYRLYWPDMVIPEEAMREKWTEREISVDHPERKKWSVRDPSIFTAGLTTNIVGLHCDIAVMDDVVVAKNAYIELGRDKTKEQYGYLSSIESVGAREWVVGTRYHPKDLYNDLMEMEIHSYDEVGNVSVAIPLFEVMQEQVESVGDGTGQFLWPRSQGNDGKWFGFDEKILAIKRSQYSTNPVHFRAQYYNDPNDDETSPIRRDAFQYYDPSYISKRDTRWYFKGERINVFAAVDFAYSTGKKSDYTSIVVVGLDASGNYFVLDIDRFKTTKISDYYSHILKLYEKWNFRKIRAEVSVAQKVIVDDLKDNYIRPNGLALIVEEYRPSRWEGAKAERIMATLQPRYANRQVWHYPGGNCQLLEEELLLANPAHDDIKDALTSCVDFAMPPSLGFSGISRRDNAFEYHSRWGGVL